jgi:hypothetical protein
MLSRGVLFPGSSHILLREHISVQGTGISKLQPQHCQTPCICSKFSSRHLWFHSSHSSESLCTHTATCTSYFCIAATTVASKNLFMMKLRAGHNSLLQHSVKVLKFIDIYGEIAASSSESKRRKSSFGYIEHERQSRKVTDLQ